MAPSASWVVCSYAPLARFVGGQLTCVTAWRQSVSDSWTGPTPEAGWGQIGSVVRISEMVPFLLHVASTLQAKPAHLQAGIPAPSP